MIKKILRRVFGIDKEFARLHVISKTVDDLNMIIKTQDHHIISIQNDKFKEHWDDVSVDFKAMRAFSIERLPRSPKFGERTNIGWIKLDDTYGSWTLFISHARHKELVEEFNNVILGK